MIPPDRAATGITAIPGSEALSDNEAVAVAFRCWIELALRYQDVANAFVRQSQIALPLGVTVIAANKAFTNSDGIAIGSQRFVKFALQVPARRPACCM
jgi:hypothetical protein